MRKIALLLFFPLSFLSTHAQRKGVILNMETGVPLKDVRIYTNNGQIDTTDYTGFYYIPYKFSSITIVKADFVSLTLDVYEMTDTIELLPRFNTLNEVVIWGKRHKMTFDTKRALKDVPNYYTPKSGMNFDFFSLFRSRTGLSREERRKHDEIIKNY
ncbi:MAG: hypothetical protein K6A82_03200 [Prevotella sp.]|nr:hypothetical protein [Prevotella sp.]